MKLSVNLSLTGLTVEVGAELEEDVFPEDEDSGLLPSLEPDTSDLPATPVSLHSLLKENDVSGFNLKPQRRESFTAACARAQREGRWFDSPCGVRLPRSPRVLE